MSERQDPTLSIAQPPVPTAPKAWLVIAHGTPRERRVPISDRPLRIGKDASADITIDNDPHISRHHAEVRRAAEGVVLADDGSRNGTFVNGVLVKEAVLTHGAVITLGTTSIRFEAGPVPPPKMPEASILAPVGSPSASPKMREVDALLAKLAPTDLNITILGETGAGKDVLARAIHAASPRKNGPFVVFDSGAVAPNLVESELFGHDRGAFTGAVSDREGAFERAHGGTLFLDEIGELPLDLQPRLLRALEQRTVKRLGAGRVREVNVRVLAATNRDLEAEVAAGRFREDLFFRLSSAVITVPPLRERTEDLAMLAAAILDEIGKPLSLLPATLQVLASHDWPGNVRELKNALASAAALAEGTTLEPRHLLFFRQRRRAPTVESLPLGGRALEALERAAIKQTLDLEGGNKTRAARALGIAPSTLYEKLKKYQLA